jgi:ligand-binding SRPBCC domain-containing protein
MTLRLERRTLLGADLAEVFEFFSHPKNLEQLTPSWLRFRIISTTSDPVQVGTRIRYRLRLFGIPFTWESLISECEADQHFVDEQIVGPYARWHHRHSFRAHAAGVEMLDAVEYRLPFGPLGRLVHWLVVRHQLRAIFDYRTSVIASLYPVRTLP